MKPTPIPDAEVMDGTRRETIGAPTGLEEHVAPAEMLVGRDDELDCTLYRARIELELGDLDRLAAGEPFWLTFWGGVPPFSVGLAEKE